MSRLPALAEKAGASRALACSMVSYIPELLTKYARGEIDRKGLLAEYARQTQKSYFYFSHMPKQEIEENRRLFAREFAFANRLSDLLMAQLSAPDDVFDEKLENCLKDYLAGVSGEPE